MTVYRLAHELYRLGVPFIPRMMSEWSHKETGIDIHPGASIGNYFFIDHGTGVVIGETCRIGNPSKNLSRSHAGRFELQDPMKVATWSETSSATRQSKIA